MIPHIITLINFLLGGRYSKLKNKAIPQKNTVKKNFTFSLLYLELLNELFSLFT